MPKLLNTSPLRNQPRAAGILSLALLALLSACITKVKSNVADVAGGAQTCPVTTNPTADLAKALVNVKPLFISSTQQYATLTPVSKNQAVTALHMLGSTPDAAALTAAGAHVTKIESYADLNLALLTFDSDLFGQGVIPQFYDDELPAGSPVVLAGYGSTQTAMPGTAMRAGNATGNLQVVDTTTTAASVPAGLEAEFQGGSVAVRGPCFSDAEDQARAANGPRLVGSKDYGLGGFAGGPVLFLGDDQKPYIIGFATASVPAVSAAQPAAASSTGALGLLMPSGHVSFIPHAPSYPTVRSPTITSPKITPFISRAKLPGYNHQSNQHKVPQHWDSKNFFDWRKMLIGLEPGCTTSEATVTMDELERYKQRLEQLGVEHEADVTVVKEGDGYTISAKDGHARLRLFPHLDPNVVEVPIDAMTIPEYIAAKDLLTTFLYGAAADVGLLPGTDEINRWDNHMNISWPDLQAGKATDLFMRFFVDYANHPELAMGIMGGDTRNATPLAYYSDTVQTNFKSIVAAYNENPEQFSSTADLAETIQRNCYTEIYHYPTVRYNAINLSSLIGKGSKQDYTAKDPTRFELRANYMTKNVEQMLASMLVVAGRLAYLAPQTSELVYNPPSLQTPSFKTTGMQDGITLQDAVKKFETYVNESGQSLTYQAENLVNPEFKATFSTYLEQRAAVREPAVVLPSLGRDSPDAADSRDRPSGSDRGGEATHGTRVGR